MLSLPQLIPTQYRIAGAVIAAALVAIALLATGYHYGAAGVQADWDAKKADQKIADAHARQQQAEHITAKVLRQTDITNEVDHAFSLGRAALSDLYGVRNDGARHHPDVPAGTGTARKPDGRPADARPGAAAPAPDVRDVRDDEIQLIGPAQPTDGECAGLRADAALTTLQLLHLRAWIAEQGAIP